MNGRRLDDEYRSKYFWSEYSKAAAAFCLESRLQNNTNNLFVKSIIGDELEWCGNLSFLHVVSRFSELQNRLRFFEENSKVLEIKLNKEYSEVQNLKKQVKQLLMDSQDHEWNLQEQIAHLGNQLAQERELSMNLRHKLSSYDAKLTDVEMYFTSDKGAITLQLEQDVAACKLRIADLEAEKDEYELMINQLKSRLKSDFENEILGKPIK